MEVWAAPPHLPIEELREAVDLVVVAGAWEGEELVQEIATPGRLGGQQDLAGLDPRACRLQARHLVTDRLDACCVGEARQRVGMQLLTELLAANLRARLWRRNCRQELPL